MNIDIFKQDSVDKIALMIFDDRIYSNSNIREDLTLSETVNAGTDFVIGSTCAAQLSFSLLDVNQFTEETDLIGKEFVYKLGVNTESLSVYKAYRQTRQDLLVKNGTYWYGGNQKRTLLTIWKEDNGTLTQQPVPQQPEQAVLSMFIWDGKLYCGHDVEPYVSAYQINANGSLVKVPVTLTSLQIAQILDLNRRHSVFKYANNLLHVYEKEWSSGKVSDYIELTYEFTQIGIFISKEAQKKDERILSVTAYDRMAYFDTTADYVLNNQQYPVTVLRFLQSLCAFVGVPLETTSFLNADYLIQKNARTQNVTGRQMLQWVAEAAARFARITPEGKLSLGWYADVNYSIDASHGGPTEYTTITAADYVTKKVDKLQIKATQNDIGVVVPKDDPKKTNLYVIENNPIFYAETDAELRPTAEKIFNAIKNFEYVPYSLSCKGNPLVRAGSAFSLTTAKGEHLRAFVMTKKMRGVKALTDELGATGNAERAVQSNAINQSIQQLRGSVHELVVDITQFKSSVIDYKESNDKNLQVLRSDITQNAKEISLRVEKSIYDKQMNQISQDFSQLRVSVDSISSTVSSHTGSISELRQTADSITSNVKKYQEKTDQTLSQQATSIKQNATQIGLRVVQETYNEKMQAVDKHFSSLDQTVEGFKLAVDNHKLVFNADGLSIYNGGFSIYNGNEKIFNVASDGSGIDMVGSILTKGPTKSILIKDGILTFSNSSGVQTGYIMSYANTLTISADVVDIGPYISSTSIGYLRVFASKDGSGYGISKGTVHMGKETFYPVLWK